MDPALWEVLDGDEEDEVAALVRLHPGHDAPSQVRVVARFGAVATCRLRRGDLLEVRGHPSVASLKAPRELVPEPAEARRARPVQHRRGISAATGAGVVVAVVDWGCDFAHPNFVDERGRTRLLALWDQRRSRGRAPTPYGYGVVHSRKAIDRALGAGDPYGALGYDPADLDPDGNGTHGTHVLDIAAGTPHVGPGGVAPDADLVFVHMAMHDRGPRSIGNSVTLLEAIDFIAGVAGDRPWVVNLSLGSHAGPHDGSTLVEIALDAVSEERGGIVVQSIGNYFRRPIHTRGKLRTGERTSFEWLVDRSDETDNELDIWYARDDRAIVRLVAPCGRVVATAAPGSHGPIVDGDRVIGRFAHRLGDPNNGDNQVALTVDPDAGRRWRVELAAVRGAGDFHAWIERDEAMPGSQSRLPPALAVHSTTTNSISNGHRTITVGAYDAATGAPAFFSSAGPTRDGRAKPDLLAPGVQVLAARSSSGDGDGAELCVKSGTSMASPHVTGTVALMLEAAGERLDVEEVRRVLVETAQPVRAGGKGRVGHGRLDIGAAVARVKRGARRKPRQGDRVVRHVPGEGLTATARVEWAFGDAIGVRDVRIGERLLRTGARWDLADAAEILPGAPVLDVFAEALQSSYFTCPGDDDAAAAAPPPRRQRPGPLGFTRPDDPKLDKSIDGKTAISQNAFWWHELRLDDVAPLYDLTPATHPNAYANRTLAAQRAMHAAGIKVDRDGMLGPRTLLALHDLASRIDLPVRWAVTALGFDLETIAEVGWPAVQSAMASVDKPEFLDQWSLDAVGAKVADLYQAELRDDPYSKARLDEYFFGVGVAAPADFTWADRVALLRELHGTRTLHGQTAMVRVQRPFLHHRDVQAMFARAPMRTEPFHHWWTFTSKKNLARAQKLLDVDFTARPKAKAAIETMKGRDIPTVGSLLTFHLPVLPESERQMAQLYVEQKKAQYQTDIGKGAADNIAGWLNSDRKLPAEKAIEDQLRQFAGKPAAFAEALFDALKLRDGGAAFPKLFARWTKVENWDRRGVLAEVVKPTRFAKEPEAVRFLDAHVKATRAARKHEYDAAAKVIRLEKGSHVLVTADVDKVKSIADEAWPGYRDDQTLKRIKPARMVELCRELTREIGERYDAMVASGATAAVDSDTLGKEAFDAASKAMQPPLSGDDIEEGYYRVSLQLHDIRAIEIDGTVRYQVKYGLVERFKREEWRPLEDPQWRSEEEFSEQLGWFRFSEMLDTLELLMTIGLVIIALCMLWATGIGAALIALAGGGTTLAVTVVFSEIIYFIGQAIRGKPITLGGILGAALEGYLAAVGFRLFAPVGAWAAKALTSDVILEKVTAWVIGRLVTGAGAGASTAVASRFLHDMVYVIRDGGSFSSWDKYLTDAGIGAAMGALFEIGGSAMFAGLGATLKGTAVDKAADLVKRMFKKGIKPAECTAEITTSLSIYRQHMKEILRDEAMHAAATEAMARRAQEVTGAWRKFKLGVSMDIHMYALELAKLDLTRGSVNGLRRMLANEQKLAQDDIDQFLKSLVAKPKQADSLLGLLGASDAATFAKLYTKQNLASLGAADDIAAFAARTSAGDAAFVLGRGGTIEGMQRWLADLAALKPGLQDQVIAATRRFGHYVSPETSLALAKAGILSDTTLVGAERLGTLGTPEALDKLVAAVPAKQLKPVLELAATDATADAFLAALMKDIGRAKRLLDHGVTPSDLKALHAAAKQDLAVVDDVLATVKPSGKLDPLETLGLQRVTRVAASGKAPRWKSHLGKEIGADGVNAKSVLRDAADLEDDAVGKLLGGGERPAAPAAPSYKARQQMVAKSQGAVETRTAYTTVDAHGPNFGQRLKARDAWVPERQAVHKTLEDAAAADARAFADAQSGPPTLYATRGNTAVGKTRAITQGHIPALKDAVVATEKLRYATLNPDNFKAGLRDADAAMPLTSQQVHWESSALGARSEEQILNNLKRTDGTTGSAIVDRRLATVEDVEKYAAIAKETGREFHVVDIDAPLQDSLAGVLRRNKTGVDGPIPTYETVAKGFEAVRQNRAEVIAKFEADAAFGTYELFGTLPDGTKRKVAEVVGGKLKTYDEAMFDALTDPSLAVAETTGTQVIRDGVIDDFVRGFPETFREDMRKVLEGFRGMTWEQALSSHGTPVKPETR